MRCSSWCVRFKANVEFDSIYDCVVMEKNFPDYLVCGRKGENFLDGNGTKQEFHFDMNNVKRQQFKAPTEFEVLCDGFRAGDGNDGVYKPEYGHWYKVTGNGGTGGTKAMFEESKCWPSFLC